MSLQRHDTAYRPDPLPELTNRAEDLADHLAQLANDTHYHQLASVATKAFLLATDLKAATAGRAA